MPDLPAPEPIRVVSPRLTRRGFLRLAVLAGLGVAAAAFERVVRPVGAANYLRWVTRGIEQRIAAPVRVALGTCSGYGDDLLSCLRATWRLAVMPNVTGKRVLVKPNLIDVVENCPTTTDPAVVSALLDLLAELGVGEVVVGDGPGFRRDGEAVAESSGLLAVLARRRVPFIDLNYDDPHPIPVRDGWFRGRSELWLPSHVRQADLIISTPKLKTHHWAGVSLSMKNLFGILPGARYGWPKNTLHINGVTPSILGLYQLARPVVAVVDGIVGMEGDGPLFGAAVPHGLLAVGTDPVAVDITCASLMGFSADHIEHLRVATWAGLGQGYRIVTVGEPAAHLQRHYQPPPSPT